MEGNAEHDGPSRAPRVETGDTAQGSATARAPDASGDGQVDSLDQSLRTELEAEAEKMRSLGQLAAGVAHDFNNALAAIVGRTQLLLRFTEDESIRRHLRIIETAALDAAETVSRIQNFARRTLKGPLKTVAASALISDTLQLTRTRWETDAQAHGVVYGIEFQPLVDASDNIHVNPSEVREVLVNLVLNALDAMPDGGHLSLDVSGGDETVVVRVADTGEGIAPEVQEHIFEPFFTTKGTSGSGLGLAVSYGIVRRHGGQIEVKSEVGKGTTFTLRFARAREGETTLPIPKTELPRLRVLVVDDEDAVREVLVEILEELKQDVVEARDASAALELLARRGFDLMITDLSMPGPDGLKLATEARRLAPAMRIVLATGYGQTAPHDAGPEHALVDRVLGKPFQLSDLEAVLWALGSEGKRHSERSEFSADTEGTI
jgi:signal transduction histidine kinase/CheY-like chemotaxis protein